jgi:ATP-dependent DNA helicase RecQ
MDQGKKNARDWIEQLVGQGCLQKTGEFNVLHVTDDGRRVLRGEITPRLLKPVERPKREAKVSTVSWEGVDRGLFDVLRALRRRKADERGLPPFVIFGDATLRNLARCRPSTPQRLLAVHGIGEKKAADYGAEFLSAIADYCREHALSVDVFDGAAPHDRGKRPTGSVPNSSKRRAWELLLQGKSVDEVCQAVGRARSTVAEYLVELIAAQEISDPSAWLDPGLCDRIRAATQQHGTQRLKPLHEALGGEATYDQLRIALACLRNAAPENQLTTDH